MSGERIRDAVFALVAMALAVLYVWAGSQLSGLVGTAASSPTPVATVPVERTNAPRIPGAIAFVSRGDVFILRDGRNSQLTSEGRSSQPFLSRDGGTLYFVRTDQIDGQSIDDGRVVNALLRYSSVVRKPAGGGTEEIVLNGLRQRSPSGLHVVSWYIGPALSADGSRLAVTVDDGDGAADLGTLAVSRAIPQGARPTLLSQGAELADAAWSPDGKQIAVTTYNTDVPGILVWSVDRPGTATRLDDLPDGEAYRPSFSPDGDWLVYTLRYNGRNDLHAYELATGKDVALTADGKSWDAIFSPDGDRVAFLREVNGVIDLYAMEIGDALTGGAAKQSQRLTSGEGIDGTSGPTWSR